MQDHKTLNSKERDAILEAINGPILYRFENQAVIAQYTTEQVLETIESASSILPGDGVLRLLLKKIPTHASLIKEKFITGLIQDAAYAKDFFNLCFPKGILFIKKILSDYAIKILGVPHLFQLFVSCFSDLTTIKEAFPEYKKDFDTLFINQISSHNPKSFTENILSKSKWCDLVLMSAQIEENPELAKKGKLYLKEDGSYISYHKDKIYAGSLLNGEHSNPQIDMSELSKKILNSNFRDLVLSITSKRGHTPSEHGELGKILKAFPQLEPAIEKICEQIICIDSHFNENIMSFSIVNELSQISEESRRILIEKILSCHLKFASIIAFNSGAYIPRGLPELTSLNKAILLFPEYEMVLNINFNLYCAKTKENPEELSPIKAAIAEAIKNKIDYKLLCFTSAFSKSIIQSMLSNMNSPYKGWMDYVYTNPQFFIGMKEFDLMLRKTIVEIAIEKRDCDGLDAISNLIKNSYHKHLADYADLQLFSEFLKEKIKTIQEDNHSPFYARLCMLSHYVSSLAIPSLQKHCVSSLIKNGIFDTSFSINDPQARAALAQEKYIATVTATKR